MRNCLNSTQPHQDTSKSRALAIFDIVEVGRLFELGFASGSVRSLYAHVSTLPGPLTRSRSVATPVRVS